MSHYLSDDEFDDLARAFLAACEATARRLAREHAYPPREFLRAIRGMDGRAFVAYATRLALTAHSSYGFHRLITMGRPQDTLEWAIAREPRWEPLFNPSIREAAEFALRTAGVPGSLTA